MVAARTARIAAGVVVEIVQAVEGFALAECYPAAFLADCGEVPGDAEPGWTATRGADGAWACAAPALPTPPVLVPTVTALGFLGLFTAEEQAGVFAAALRKPDLLGLLFQVACAGTVQLTDPRVIAGVGLLQGAGLVAPSRPVQVLGNVAAPAAADAVSFDVARATESDPARADAVTFDFARATESIAARATAVSFDTIHAAETTP